MISKEIFMQIIGHEDYQISNLGNIIKSKNSKEIKAFVDDLGYLKVHLNRKIFRLHRLIATHFIPNPDNKRTVNHKNGIKTDNRLENLEWATDSENNKHAYRTGLKKPTFLGKSTGNSKKCVKKSVSDNTTIVYESVQKAANDSKISRSHIANLITNNRPYKGYLYSFL